MTVLAHSIVSIVSAGLALFIAAAATHAAEIAYPTKAIRLIVPFPPGGSADPLARVFGAWFSDKFGVPVIADNRPGAGTAIAHTLGARAAKDGYTLLLGSSSGLTTNPAMGSKLDYDPVKDFAYVSLAAYVPQFLVVYPAVPAKGVKELIDLAKAQPGKISFGSPGVGTVGHLSLELIIAASGAKFVHVPYKGAGPAVIDLVGGRIQALFASVAGTQAQVSGGRIRAIATGHRERLRSWPDVPTVAEALPLPGFSNNGWYGIVGPAGMPAPIINKLNAEMKRALSNAEFAKHVEAIGMEPAGSTPQELRDWTRSELARWTKVVRDAGIQAPQN
ncbi:MAG TPA: tripartite tricarboxylate transporter substrate binding protein [Burkholderiales bacterium]|jgi:tripartite-type tricarboxylate transporter receptor subunit TctC|nr:tripartite tricarboxylate transporter substrate binding protein [Burkholderiales bacterium]